MKKPLYRDDHPVRFWFAREFASVEEILEHVAAGGVSVTQTPASSKSGETRAPQGGARSTYGRVTAP